MIEGINLKSINQYQNKIIAKYSYKHYIKRDATSKIIDIALDLNLPPEILKEIKFFRVLK